ncbi:MAG: hypothetical protein Q7S53_02675 [bacterium]|nr:hypothetical protein [bacterium]
MPSGYAICPSCKKFLFEEDFEKGKNKIKDKKHKECRWCTAEINMSTLTWVGSYAGSQKNNTP